MLVTEVFLLVSCCFSSSYISLSLCCLMVVWFDALPPWARWSLAHHCLTTVTLPVPSHHDILACTPGFCPDVVKSYFKLGLSSGAVVSALWPEYTLGFVPGCTAPSWDVCSQTATVFIYQLSFLSTSSWFLRATGFIPCWFLTV